MAARKSLEHRRGTGLAADKLRQVFSPRDEKLFPLQVGDLRVKQGDHVEAGALLMTLKTATGKKRNLCPQQRLVVTGRRCLSRQIATRQDQAGEKRPGNGGRR